MMNRQEKQAAKVIRDYILPRDNRLKIRSLIFTIIFIPLCLIQVVMVFKAFRAPAVPCAQGRYRQYVYADILSPGVYAGKCLTDYPSCDYYVAPTSDGAYCVLAVQPDDYSLISDTPVSDPQNNNTPNSQGKTRVFGAMHELSYSERKRIIALLEATPESAEMISQLTESGEITGYIDVGDRNAIDIAAEPVIFILLLTLCWLVTMAPYNRIYGGASRSLRRLKKRGLLLQAADELAAEDGYYFGAESAVATAHFIFCGRFGNVLCYDDIIKAYPQIVTFKNNITVGGIIAETSRRRKIFAVPLGVSDIDRRAADAITVIREHAPSIIAGAAEHKHYPFPLRVHPRRAGNTSPDSVNNG